MDPFDQNPEEAQAKQRPAIVTVFAILTIIGNVLTIIFAFVPMDTFTEGLAGPQPDPPGWIAWGGVPLAMGKLGGAILLLRMQRTGFFLYTLSEALAAILQVVAAKFAIDALAGYPMDPSFPLSVETIVIAMTGLSLVLSVVWIGGYASQLHKMD